ncbi:MAG: neutral zinc metallopeptidase [Arenibacterium sp.]
MRLRRVERSSNNAGLRKARWGRGRAGAVRLGLASVFSALALACFTGLDVTLLLHDLGDEKARKSPASSLKEQRVADFAGQVLTTTETVWQDIFKRQLQRQYVPPEFVLYRGVTNSACGGASATVGPFYCPEDQKTYLDLAFFETFSNRLGAKGDFAAAYVIAHEIAHHVQNQLGILAQVDAAHKQANRVDGNKLIMRLELQADCLSGIWARNVSGLMERGDLEEALNAARMMGDDHLQRAAGYVPQPHTFTHGSSKQRAAWFKRGYDSGALKDCDTFSAL